MSKRLAAALAVLLLATGALAQAQQAPAPDWPTEKCVRYRKAWDQLAARTKLVGIGEEFRKRHDAFLAGNCLERTDVCPRSKEELDTANAMVIAAMNGGMASTFLPFACR